jgi:hypothetical protein
MPVNPIPACNLSPIARRVVLRGCIQVQAGYSVHLPWEAERRGVVSDQISCREDAWG